MLSCGKFVGWPPSAPPGKAAVGRRLAQKHCRRKCPCRFHRRSIPQAFVRRFCPCENFIILTGAITATGGQKQFCDVGFQIRVEKRRHQSTGPIHLDVCLSGDRLVRPNEPPNRRVYGALCPGVRYRYDVKFMREDQNRRRKTRVQAITWFSQGCCSSVAILHLSIDHVMVISSIGH
ncbi:unnamed protein product [Soboliphyme baturini]|uniref:NTR domain-containing protein n=1 Tax=Soboliphyme baturini TaxID=241478 RepID=A0A183I9G8_9BILA|nr:unnamed protein product [Soboliphyme baturini]